MEELKQGRKRTGIEKRELDESSRLLLLIH
jgi:hypothetical protein